jgi:hypothetical protein
VTNVVVRQFCRPAGRAGAGVHEAVLVVLVVLVVFMVQGIDAPLA